MPDSVPPMSDDDLRRLYTWAYSSAMWARKTVGTAIDNGSNPTAVAYALCEILRHHEPLTDRDTKIAMAALCFAAAYGFPSTEGEAPDNVVGHVPAGGAGICRCMACVIARATRAANGKDD